MAVVFAVGPQRGKQPLRADRVAMHGEEDDDREDPRPAEIFGADQFDRTEHKNLDRTPLRFGRTVRIDLCIGGIIRWRRGRIQRLRKQFVGTVSFPGLAARRLGDLPDPGDRRSPPRRKVQTSASGSDPASSETTGDVGVVAAARSSSGISGEVNPASTITPIASSTPERRACANDDEANVSLTALA